MNYGQIEYRISNRNTNLCKDSNFELSGQIDLSKDNLDNHFRKVLYQRSDPSSNLRGSYYICIKSLKYSSFSVTPGPKTKQNASDSRLQINDLPAGEQLFGQISDHTKAVYFSIEVNLAENSNEYITVSLSSIVGKFKIVASNDGNLPDFHQHFWKSNQEGILVISSQDANFKPKTKYIIGVWLLEAEKQHIGKFMITYSYSEKHTLLYPGFTFQSALGKQAKAAYRILIPKDVESLLLLKTPKTDDVKLYLTFDSSKPYPNVSSN